MIEMIKQKTITCKSCNHKIIVLDNCVDIKTCPECDGTDLVIE